LAITDPGLPKSIPSVNLHNPKTGIAESRHLIDIGRRMSTKNQCPGGLGMSKESPAPDKPDAGQLLTALGHPMRREILQVMASEEAISPREIKDRLNQPLSAASYHVRVLAECNAIALVRTEAVRGSMKHFYRFNIDVAWALHVLGLDPRR
jgi:DNA-binding transcriptional ArsR family regulator